MVERKENSKLWTYTDDVIAILVVIAWFIAYGMGHKLPEWILTTVLGYVFGKHIPLSK